MLYKEIIPGKTLQPYVKHYYLFESDTATTFTDTVFPGGSMEIIFNLGAGVWQSLAYGQYYTTPPVELWGQITRPLPIRSIGKHCMLGIRFYPHSAGLFLNEELSALNDQITDGRDIYGNTVRHLYEQLQNTSSLDKRIILIETFLLQCLAANEDKCRNISFIQHLLQDIKTDLSIQVIAARYNISTRYLHKLVYRYTGLSPKQYNKIHRFQQSLKLITSTDSSLTAVAYDCGYFDQAHFIKDFKSFTGTTPSAYLAESFPVNQIFTTV